VRTARAKGLREFTVVRRHVCGITAAAGHRRRQSLATLVEGAFAETPLGILAGQLAFNRSRAATITSPGVIRPDDMFIFANIIIDIAYTSSTHACGSERQSLG
jgi:ABC-type dipeptide/oligopeptide/nickel transport system permease component